MQEEEKYKTFSMRSDSDTLRPELKRKIQRWIVSFYLLDPRQKILKFFSQVAAEGADHMADETDEFHSVTDSDEFLRRSSRHFSLLKKVFSKSTVMTVWRPTSKDAMRKMMEGTGVGKGLDIKGKSAKKGTLSALVPFMQIHENAHKTQIAPIPLDAKMRVYYSSEKDRDEVVQTLQQYINESVHDEYEKEEESDQEEIRLERIMDMAFGVEKRLVGELKKLGSALFDPEMSVQHAVAGRKGVPRRGSNFRKTLVIRRVLGEMTMLDEYAPDRYGIELTQRLFWEGYVEHQEITRDEDTKTGRMSTPGFQDANLKTLKIACAADPRPEPMPVVLQTDPDNPMAPQTLIMAYEESGKIRPVVSDFDGFLMGWRRESPWFGCNLPNDQEKLMMWCLGQIEKILDGPPSKDTWTMRWLEILKQATHEGLIVDIPEYGFGDPKSYSIMENAALRLIDTGAVRHGSECFNYYFPQEIDEYFLLVSDTLKPVPWKYVNEKELLSFLSEKIKEGFVFPLNPKWILCDPGWKTLYDELMASEALYADLSKDVWFPPFSGVREKIEEISKRHPDGFLREGGKRKKHNAPLRRRGLQMTSSADLALELDNLTTHSKKQAFQKMIEESAMDGSSDSSSSSDDDDDNDNETKFRGGVARKASFVRRRQVVLETRAEASQNEASQELEIEAGSSQELEIEAGTSQELAIRKTASIESLVQVKRFASLFRRSNGKRVSSKKSKKGILRFKA